MMSDLEVLDTAARQLRHYAGKARRIEDERWTVDQTEDGLVVGAYTPGDVDEDGTISIGCVAFFAYPGDKDQATYSNALAVASHMAAFDPEVADDLAAWLESHKVGLEHHRGDVEACDSPHDTQRAVRLARKYMRSETS